MFQSTYGRQQISQMLSEVLDDIGVNEGMVKRARKVFQLIETMSDTTSRLFGRNNNMYIVGSQNEGTTTSGLCSDADCIMCMNSCNIIQNLLEWEHGKLNYFMIQDENTTPGYCFLQLLRNDVPLPATNIPDDRHITDRRGRILHKNTIPDVVLPRNATLQGPSVATINPPGFCDSDKVLAYPCKSWPNSASGWLERQGIRRWPKQKIRTYAGTKRCLVVPTGSKISVNPELEWRISTSLAERCLMFDLNITQIRCYVLMKIVLKSFLNPQGKINISSFMCKTILFHCMEHNEPSIWKENNVLECLKECLLKLQSCVQDEHLSHFIIPENNLMAGQFTARTKQQLLDNINNFIQNDVENILEINIDSLKKRLSDKIWEFSRDLLQRIFRNDVDNYGQLYQNEQRYSFNSSLKGREGFSANIYIVLSKEYGANHVIQLQQLHKRNIRIMKQTVEMIMTCNRSGTEFEQAACKIQAPLLYSTYGSVLASASIGLKHHVSPEALHWLQYGLDSDISSGRLKLASVFYSTGDMEKTQQILRHTEQQYYSYPVLPICSCRDTMPFPELTAEFARICYEHNEDYVKNITAFCVRFLQQEINCVPHELQYEMFRSTQDDIKHRDTDEDFWMDLAVVDSLPFLYFLKYKVYRHLKRYEDQHNALNKLSNIIETDKNLRHKETSLNILGQCLEQENRPQQAIKCYLLSLRQRERDNVARIHICRLLSSLLVGKEIDKQNHTYIMIGLNIMQYLLELNRSY